MEDLHKTLQLAQNLGILINQEKSELVPSQSVVYLGMKIDSRIFRAFPSNKKIQSCTQKIRHFLNLQSRSANDWMSLLGTLSSIEMFIPLGRLHERPLQFFLKAN